jgi:hypothetical protein
MVGSVEPFQVLQDAVRVVDDLVAVYEDGYPALPRQLLDLGPVALQEGHADLLELDARRAQAPRDLAAAADEVGRRLAAV